MAKMTKIKRLIVFLTVLIMTLSFAVETSAYSLSRGIANSFISSLSQLMAGKAAASLPEGYHKCESLDDAAKYVQKKLVAHEAKIKFSFTLENQPDFEELAENIRQNACQHTGKPNEGDYLLFQVGFEYNAEIYQRDEKYLYYFTINPIYFTTEEQENKVAEKVKEVIDELELDGLSDYEKVRKIYSYITNNVDYDKEIDQKEGYLSYSAYAALIDGKAVCQGYANLFYRLCLEAGIDCRIVAGTCRDEGHAWNIINIGDYYYHCDATWDAAGNTEKYFLKCPQNISNHTLYEEFETGDFAKKYVFDTADCLPPANGTVIVAFNSDGGKCDTGKLELKSGEKLEKLPYAAKENAVFTGWYTRSGKAYASGMNITNSFSLIAGWAKEVDNSKLHSLLKTKDGIEISTESAGVTTVLIFGDTDSSSKNRKLLNDISSADSAIGKDVRIIYVDIIDNKPKSDYSVPLGVICCPYLKDNAAVCWSYKRGLVSGISNLILPYVVVIDGDDKIVYASSAQMDYNDFKNITINSVKNAINEGKRNAD